jgi:hypothetical protein
VDLAPTFDIVVQLSYLSSTATAGPGTQCCNEVVRESSFTGIYSIELIDNAVACR